jgi:hypothetical protein
MKYEWSNGGVILTEKTETLGGKSVAVGYHFHCERPANNHLIRVVYKHYSEHY